MRSGFQAWRVLKHCQTIGQYLIVPAMRAMTDWMDGVRGKTQVFVWAQSMATSQSKAPFTGEQCLAQSLKMMSMFFSFLSCLFCHSLSVLNLPD